MTHQNSKAETANNDTGANIADLRQEVLAAQKSEAQQLAATAAAEARLFDVQCRLEILQSEKGDLVTSLGAYEVRIAALSEQTLRNADELISLESSRSEITRRLSELQSTVIENNEYAQARSAEIIEANRVNSSLKSRNDALTADLKAAKERQRQLEDRVAGYRDGLAARELALSNLALRCETSEQNLVNVTTLAETRLSEVSFLTELSEVARRRIADMEKTLAGEERKHSGMVEEHKRVLLRLEEANKKATMSNQAHLSELGRLTDLNENARLRIGELEKSLVKEKQTHSGLVGEHRQALLRLEEAKKNAAISADAHQSKIRDLANSNDIAHRRIGELETTLAKSEQAHVGVIEQNKQVSLRLEDANRNMAGKQVELKLISEKFMQLEQDYHLVLANNDKYFRQSQDAAKLTIAREEKIRALNLTINSLSHEHRAIVEKQEEKIRNLEMRVKLGDQYRSELNALKESLAVMTTEHNNSLHEADIRSAKEISERDEEISKLRSSTSWKVTAPMRATKNLFTSH